MDCPYLTEKVDITFMHKYCTVCGKFTYDMDPDPYAEHCHNWATGYEACPYYPDNK